MAKLVAVYILHVQHLNLYDLKMPDGSWVSEKFLRKRKKLVLLQEVTDESSRQNENENVRCLSWPAWLNILQYFFINILVSSFSFFSDFCALLCQCYLTGSFSPNSFCLLLFSFITCKAHFHHNMCACRALFPFVWQKQSWNQFYGFLLLFLHSFSSFIPPTFFSFSALGDKKGRFSCFQKVGEKQSFCD